MKIGLYQYDVAREAPAENLRRIDQGTRKLDVDLLVLPELCTSGYLLSRSEAWRQSVEIPSDGLAPLARIAERLGAWLVAGVIERESDRLYNTTVLVGPRGCEGRQRKVHLTSLEQKLFSAGTDFQSFQLGAAKVGVVTCFDAWFPEASRQLARSGVQLLCQPAAFGGPSTLEVMRVRSLENHVFSVTANRIGAESRNDVRASFRGESQIVACDGRVVARAGAEPAAVLARLDLAQANDKSAPMCADLSVEWQRYYPG